MTVLSIIPATCRAYFYLLSLTTNYYLTLLWLIPFYPTPTEEPTPSFCSSLLHRARRFFPIVFGYEQCFNSPVVCLSLANSHSFFERRCERRDWKWNNSNTRSGISNQISCDKNATNRNREQMQNVNNLMRQWNASYRHVQYWQKNIAYRDTIQCMMNCTVTCARKYEENYTTNSSMASCRNWYKQVMKVMLLWKRQCKPT